MEQMTNLELWDKLGKTDPAQTKGFKRAGGFAGTAIKPIYTEHKMTETFGPCGIGWGIGEPVFQTAPGSDGQLAVYCSVSIWISHDGKVSAPIYGVGGDMVVVKQSAGLRTDDEAFKKAFTDAIGNAMKHLGMSADVHMGRFDDSKYVASVRGELAASAPAFAEPDTKAESRDEFAVIMAALRVAGGHGRPALREFWTSANFLEAFEVQPEDFQKELVAEKAAFLANYAKPTLKADPNETLDRQFSDTMGR
jgi:hypothetical protein